MYKNKLKPKLVMCHSVIIATGATAKRLHMPREDEFWSRGISACAICDGASPLFKGQVLAVVGGGDTATEEALYLTKYARHVHLLVRREQLRASKAMQDRHALFQTQQIALELLILATMVAVTLLEILMENILVPFLPIYSSVSNMVDSGECFRVINNPNVTVHFNTETVDVVSNSKGQMSGILLRRLDTREESVLEVKGLFYGIGHTPNSQLLEGQIELDTSGYVLVKEGTAKTSVQGVFAAGDVQDHEWRQAITAAGSGCVAALSVERYLTSNNLLAEFHQLAYIHLLIKLIFSLVQVIDEYDQNVHFVEIDIEEDPEVAEAAGIMGTPCVQFFKNKDMIRLVILY
ncbi:hypothetical protein GIB67_035195 [Kingdonia uniflora]|uniref:FAD/NAD(P)-binding domain-containing protein n=1 Tax=Kingdonia uniflora TaxID=39325 RepID=A0A7J7LDV5_9MAGN|nr:hypothetical protein GIB67_035195 [Kingdonia uniflora]